MSGTGQRIAVTAQDAGAQYGGQTHNAALDLANTLGELSPMLNTIATQVGNNIKTENETSANRDALATSGAKFKDAVASGAILPTQNPWYIQAYNRESSAISSQKDLSALQLDSTTWPEQNDPQAFQQRWNQGVGALAKQYGDDTDRFAGFKAAEGQVTQQTLASNQAQNVQRIVSERSQNVTALGADSLVQLYKSTGGVPTGLDSWKALQAAHLRWTATGGTESDWQKLVPQMVTAAGYSTNDPGMIDVLKELPMDGSPPPTATSALPSAPSPQVPTTMAASAAAHADLSTAILGQESGNKDNVATSNTGAVGPGQIEPATFAKFAQPGEDINNPADNRAVSKRIIASYQAQYTNGGVPDPARVAVAYYSGPGNVSPVGSPTPWLSNITHDSKGRPIKSVASYTQDILNRLDAQAGLLPPPVAQPDATRPVTTLGVPSLFEQGEVGENASTAQYRIAQNAEYAATGKMRTLKALQAEDAQKGLNVIYAQNGPEVLTGQYDVNTLVSQMTAAGVTPQGQAEALQQLHSGVDASQGLMEAKHKILGDNPQVAKATMDLDLYGKKNGWSQPYEDQVGQLVLRGVLTGTDGEKMVNDAVTKSKEDAKDVSGSGTTVRNYTQIKEHADTLAQTIGFVSKKNYGIDLQTEEFNQFKDRISNAGGAWLESHAGDYNGAYQAMKAETAREIQQMRQTNTRPRVNASVQSDGGNPRRAQ